jgi:hypothetical protein
MKINKRALLGIYLCALLALLVPGSSSAAEEAKASLKGWIGIWIPDDESFSSKAIVEIRPTADGQGIEISRKAPQQPDVKEVLILDGTKQPLIEKNCSGWRISKLNPHIGAIISASEVNCSDSESFRTSSVKIILSANQLIDILGITSGDQTQVAIRRLTFNRELPSATGSLPRGVGGSAERTEVSATWTLDDILQLAGTVDDQVFQAALMEKFVRLNLDAKSLRQMKAAKLSNESIDLLVALAYPDRFIIETNGKVSLEPVSASSAMSLVGSSSSPSPGYYPNSYGYLANQWLYYGSPFWVDRYLISNYRSSRRVSPARAPAHGTEAASRSHGYATHQGYAQITPVANPSRRAMPRGVSSRTHQGGSKSSSRAPASGASSSAPSSGSNSSGGSSSGSSGSSSGASSSGYSSGSGGGRIAVPR